MEPGTWLHMGNIADMDRTSTKWWGDWSRGVAVAGCCVIGCWIVGSRSQRPAKQPEPKTETKSGSVSTVPTSTMPSSPAAVPAASPVTVLSRCWESRRHQQQCDNLIRYKRIARIASLAGDGGHATAIDRIRPEIRLAPDSAPEGSGFEPSVPLPRLSSIRAVRAEIIGRSTDVFRRDREFDVSALQGRPAPPPKVSVRPNRV